MNDSDGTIYPGDSDESVSARTEGKHIAPRVGFFIQHFPPYLGGAEKQAELLAGQLVAMGQKVEVVSTRHHRGLASRSFVDGLKIWRYPQLPFAGPSSPTIFLWAFILA